MVVASEGGDRRVGVTFLEVGVSVNWDMMGRSE